MGVLIFYIILFGGGYKLYKWFQIRKRGINIVRLDQELQSLNEQRNRLMALHSMITDVDLCSYKAHTYKIFNISWIDDITGEKQEYDLFIADNKNANAKALRTLATIEIAEIKPSLNDDIERFKLRSHMMTKEQKQVSGEIEREVETMGETSVHF
jgi:hypothetical protein